MRTSKIVALVATAALLAVGAAFTAMAATGWVEESGSWKYYDKNGDAVTEKFVKSGDNWYYLDSDEYMATDKLVEYNDNYYYVDESGKMVSNTWKKIANNDGDDNYGEYIYYYFQGSGKAYKGTAGAVTKSVNGKKYVFDENGKMRYGWLDKSLNFVNNDDGKAYKEGNYYCGGADDGARVTSKWVKLSYTSDNGDDGSGWFYFDNNGNKVVANKTINGKKYAFDANGVMQAEWASVSTDNAASISKYGWFQDAENGARLANGWFKVVPQASVNEGDNTDETAHWFWANKKGELAKSCLKTINGKTYGFNARGEMVSGLQLVEVTDDGTFFYPVDNSKVKVSQVWDLDKVEYVGFEKSGVRFFSDDEANDGSMKTGSVKVTVDGDEYNCKFATKGTGKGVGQTGKDGSYYYLNGCKITADGELKCQPFPAKLAGEGISTLVLTGGPETKITVSETGMPGYVLLTSSGVIVQNGTKTNSDGYKFTVKSYAITKVEDTNK